MAGSVVDREGVLDAFRRWGYLQARIDPFGRITHQAVEGLPANGELAEIGEACYCGSIGAEFMHIADARLRRWIQERMEGDRSIPNRSRILERIVRAEVFEQVLHVRSPGTKRFSLEGVASLIPLLDEILNGVAERGAVEAIIGMSHRGRLNVMVHVVGKTAEEIFAEFQDVDPQSVLGGGDVKYHIGATGLFTTNGGPSLQVRLVSNPSHLEAVDPVAMGRTRAKQSRLGKEGRGKILLLMIHGDAAFAGQGITAETLNLSTLKGYSVGGIIHIIVNNLLGFTANPDELCSSQFASDIAKRLPIPVFHVNAEDPDAVVRAGRIAADYRSAFESAVVVDLIGFRRHGHSELEDPTVTQPLLYRKINDHPPLWKLYAEACGIDAQPIADSVRTEYDAAQARAATAISIPRLSTLPGYWLPYTGGPAIEADTVGTSVNPADLIKIGELLTTPPAGFSLHPKTKVVLERRRQMTRGELPLDFGMAELLAFGTLLQQGVPVRLTGQDSRRGTFGQRQAVLIDVETEREHIPLCHVAVGQPEFEVYNSPLSEAAVLGFEYGFSRDAPEALVLWEAQFGDFANGAQLIIDQFISAAEDKWGLLSGLVLLLPHGYEGQGPEHSSARLERFLQLAAEDNIQVCQPSTAAQYFHLLRRQALRYWRKPLIILTPKSMLRHPDACSGIGELFTGTFLRTLKYPDPDAVTRILICSGKIGHELHRQRQRLEERTTAIVSIEELYPFPEESLARVLQGYLHVREIVWVQEEPGNMGALAYVLPKLGQLAAGRPVRSVKRSPSASPATGSAKAHAIEQTALVNMAFSSGVP
jgi:2-oxoglutarate dehydrogenase E1 component